MANDCSNNDAFAAARKRMVREQLSGFPRRVLAAMARGPRHEFVPRKQQSRVYAEGPLPIGFGQTISQPYIVAAMTAQLDPKPADRVLEVGTGSGYQTAVLAQLVGKVYTIEIIEPLAARAAASLRRLGCDNVHLRTGDGYSGWPEAAPFDAIIVTCAPEQVPPPLAGQLKENGRMIIPVGPLGNQELMVLQKQEMKLVERAIFPVRFVPMTGAAEAGRRDFF
jgi:protein-L-isoaspartate(D-aspartate) O-methyltransferase